LTAILQLAPTSSALPQALLIGVWGKSPLVLMLLMFSVALPVLVTVTSFAGPVMPRVIVFHFSNVGARVTTGLPPAAFTVRLTVVVGFKPPDVPVIVTVAVPVAAVALAVNVNVVVEAVGLLPNADVTPLGRPEALKVTLSANPLAGTTVMVIGALLLPWLTVAALGTAVRLKLGIALAEQPGKLNVPIAVLQLKPPLAFSYSSVNQNVQSSEGSIVREL
jgi:hypothetical protein